MNSHLTTEEMLSARVVGGLGGNLTFDYLAFEYMPKVI